MMVNPERPQLGLWISLTDPFALELAKVCGFDYVRLDNEYIPYSYAELAQMIRTANLLKLPIHVRISRMEDIDSLVAFGADGIIVPNCNSADRAREAITRVKYHPLGERGINFGSRAVVTSGLSGLEYVVQGNKRVSLTIQIEHVDARSELDDILSLEGIDMVSSGRGDISQSLGIPGQVTHPSVLKFEDEIIDKALAHGKKPVVMVASPEELSTMAARGVDMFTVGLDGALLRQGMSGCIGRFRVD